LVRGDAAALADERVRRHGGDHGADRGRADRFGKDAKKVVRDAWKKVGL
jgi:hypothetical protein